MARLIKFIYLYSLFIIFSMPFSLNAQAQKAKTRKEMIELVRNLNVTYSVDENVEKHYSYVITKNLPLVNFNNPYIANKIKNEISKNRYLENHNDDVYVALRPDSTIIISRCTNGIWLASGNTYEERTKHLYNNYIGHIKCNGHVVPIAVAKDLPISWVEQDSTEMATGTIRYGIPTKTNWKIISVKSMLRGREQIDSLTRNEMIHSWFDR